MFDVSPEKFFNEGLINKINQNKFFNLMDLTRVNMVKYIKFISQSTIRFSLQHFQFIYIIAKFTFFSSSSRAYLLML